MSDPVSPPDRRLLVGTAGHIDHGKTRLVEALTGIDCDRWAAEKERGITIDLGFAHLERDGFQIGFVDVPGHERFLDNALAGLGGIRVMLLVVAADEGVKPQTLEHLEICSLLEIPGAAVALTKTDLATPDLVELARLEIEELLAPTPFAGARVVPVSAATGEGIPELADHLVELAERFETATDPDRPARLPIDRAFHLTGLGVVVTGTLAGGAVEVGDRLELVPGGAEARVRSVQVHGASRDRAETGERTALQLAGPGLGELGRGVQLVTPGGLGEATLLLGSCRLADGAPKPLRGSTPVVFHLLSSEVQGRVRPLGGTPIEPGETGPVEIKLAAPVAVARGDRFVLRRPSPRATLGGGVVLDPRWKRRRGLDLERAIERLGGSTADALRAWAEEAGEAGLELDDAALRLGRHPNAVAAELAALVADGRLIATPESHRAGRRWLPAGAPRRVEERAARFLADYFERHRLARGAPKAEAVERILPGRAAELADVYLDWLVRREVVAVDGGLVTLPGRSASLSGEESKLAAELERRFTEAGLSPPGPAEVGRAIGAKPQIVDGVVAYLVERGRLARLPGGLLVATAAVERLTAELRDTGWDRFRVPAFKERFGLTRKWAIPLLEHLDSIGVTRRLGDERMLAGRRPPADG